MEATDYTIVLEGTLEEGVFDNPNILYFVQVAGLHIEQSRVSATGQQIFIPPEVLSGSHEELLSQLVAEAQARRLARILPAKCLKD